MELVPYEPWHFEYLAMPMPQGKNMGLELVKIYAMAYYVRGRAYTIKDKGKIVGCAGVLDLWPGVGEAWTCLTDDARAKPFFLHRRTYKIIRKLIETGTYHRVQAIVCCEDAKPVQWIERLGFVKESVMKKFGADGSDHAMYVWSGQCL
jgi:hypothetical protein